MRGVIDRFESDYAIIETEEREMVNVEIKMLPVGAKEGDFIAEENGIFYIDKSETEKRKKKIEDLMEDLFE